MSYFGLLQKTIANVAVWYLRQKNLGTFLESSGLLLDGAADGMVQGMRLGYPLRCPSNQLPVIAYDRGIRLYPSEPDASKRQRLRMWWQLHKQRGSHQGEMRHVAPYFLPGGLPTIRIVHQSGDGLTATWHTLDTSGKYTSAVAGPSNFNFDGKTSEWSRFFGVIDMSTTGFSPPRAYDSGGQYDTSGWQYDEGAVPLTAQAMADIAAMLGVDWKAANSWCLGVALWWPMTGGAPFPSAAGTPTQNAAGWWSLPNGAGTWASLVGTDGRGTRPPNMTWILDNPSP